MMFIKAQNPMEEHMVHNLPQPHQSAWLYTGGIPKQTIVPNHEQGEGWRDMNEWEYEITWREGTEK